jgi:hypothetical protein
LGAHDEPSLAVCCKETRESNPQTDFCNQCDGLQLERSDPSRAAPAQHLAVNNGHPAASNGTLAESMLAAVTHISQVWPDLRPHIREAILTLVDADRINCHGNSIAGDSTVRRSKDINSLASRFTKERHHVIQRCLREEE